MEATYKLDNVDTGTSLRASDLRRGLSAQFRRIEFIALLLGLLTALLMLWHEWGMNRVLVVSPGETFEVWAQADAENHGQSVAHFSESDAFEMRCEMRDTIAHPYCNLYIQLVGEDAPGLDLSRYDTLVLDMEHHSPEQDTVRVFLSHYFLPGETEQTDFAFKQNQSVIIPYEGRASYSIPISEFYVPSWWVYVSRLNQNEKGPDLTNVRRMVISTGDNVAARTQTIKLYRAEFHGKWISAEALYRGLLFAWVALTMGYLSLRGYRLNRELAARRAEAKQLQSLNRILDVRSKRYEDMAKRDDLTGVLNRAGIRNVLQEAAMDFSRNRIPFSVLMLDIDHFKQVNDVHGHDAGDEVLKHFAKVVGARCRGSDVLARWGGEEFVVVCPTSTKQAAAVLAENLCETIRNAEFPNGIPVTCSIGVAQVKSTDIKELFNEADEALYLAKESGRDKVQVYAG